MIVRGLVATSLVLLIGACCDMRDRDRLARQLDGIGGSRLLRREAHVGTQLFEAAQTVSKVATGGVAGESTDDRSQREDASTLGGFLSRACRAEPLLRVLLIVAGGVLVSACAAGICVLAQRRPGRANVAPTTGHAGSPTWPRRRHYMVLAVLFTVIAIYGSLVPLRFEALPLHEGIEHFRHMPYRPLATGGRADFVANVLLAIPISCFWLAVLLLDHRSLVRAVIAAPLAVLLTAVLSAGLEFCQLWFPYRSVSQNDIIAQTVGAVIGVVLWLIVGQEITDWIRSLTPSTRRNKYVEWLLQAYLLWLVLYSVRPLDLTISVTRLARKYRLGRITLVPFSGMESGLALLYDSLRNLGLFIPVGILAATWLTSAERPVRRITTSVLLGGLVVAGIELAQLIVYSRPAATADVITGTLGVLVGASLTFWWRVRAQGAPVPPACSGAARARWLWLGLAGLYVVLLVVVFCAPFELIEDRQEMWARYDGFFYVPFARVSRGSELYMICDVLKKILFFVPLGMLFGLASRPLDVPPAIRRILLAVLLIVAAGIGTSIEMAQVLLAQHVPDVSDVILYTVGAGVGMLVTARKPEARQAAGSLTRT